MRIIKEFVDRHAYIVFLFPALVIYTLFHFWPIVQSFPISFTDWDGVGPRNWIGLQNYVRILTVEPFRGDFLNALSNTLTFFAIVFVVQNGLALLLATIVGQEPKGHNLYRVIYFIPFPLSAVAVGYLWRLILDPYAGPLNEILEAIGLTNLALPWLGDPRTALPAIALVHSWKNLGFPFMLFLANLSSIPRELYEVGEIEGANSWQAFRHITFPLLATSVTIVTVLTWLGTIGMFDIVYAMAGVYGEPGGHTQTLMLYFYNIAFSASSSVGLGAAIAVLNFLLMLVACLAQLIVLRRREVQF